MDRRLVTALQSIGSMNRQEAAMVLVSAFVATGAGRHAVRAARDSLNGILAQARNGTPQLIGHKPKDMIVVMLLSDLVDMVRVGVTGQSFGEALDAAGFRPASGKKMAVRQGFLQEPLLRKRSSKKSGGE